MEETSASTLDATMNEKTGRLSLRVAEIAGFVDGVSSRVTVQAGELDGLRASTRDAFADCAGIVTATEQACRCAVEARSDMDQSYVSLDKVVAGISTLAQSISTMGQQGDVLEQALLSIDKVATQIGAIATQTKMLAINAAIEAARAGAAGSGFGVVATEVRGLAAETASATQAIRSTIGTLRSSAKDLIRQAQDSRSRADGVSNLSAATLEMVGSNTRRMAEINAMSGNIAERTSAIHRRFATIEQSTTGMAARLHQSDENLREARDTIADLLTVADEVAASAVNSGAVTADSPYLRRAQSDAARLSALFAEQLASDAISMQDLFDDQYVQVPGSNPPQFITRFTETADRIVRSVLQDTVDSDGQIEFCTALDHNGYLTTHVAMWSQPQRDDPVWNGVNCRNRVLHRDKVTARACANLQPFLLQSFRRTIGDGEFRVMKHASAPIFVGQRHWGMIAIGYRPGIDG